MGGFDIANMRNRKSFAASLRKRKALGLNDSDSDDDLPKKRTVNKATVKKVESENDLDEIELSTTKPVAPTKPIENVETTEIDPALKLMQEALNTTDQYLAEAEALMSKPVNLTKRQEPVVHKKEKTIKRESSTQSNDNSAIELSDDDKVEDEISLANDDIADLDPDLARISREIASAPSRKASKVSIKLTYVHNFTQVSETMKAIIDKLIKPVKIIILDNDQFHTALNAFCKKKNLRKEDIVLTYKNNLVFLNSTPAGVGMSDIGTYDMEVYPEKCYNDMLKEKEAKRSEMRRRFTEGLNDEIENEYIPPAPIEQPQDENWIILKLRDKNNNDTSMRVKPTTILNSVVAKYKEGLKITTEVKLSFEGEILDLNQSVEDTDLEDQDMIEVIS